MDNLCSIQALFAGRMFRVPNYQRGYAWEAPQWRDLLEDLEMLPEGRQHYTGTVVLCPAADGSSRTDLEGNSHDLYDIVDGQQRLTTIVLLLDAIRREMTSFEARQALAGGIAKTYIVVQDLNGQPMPKLTLNRDCHAFFFGTILGQSPSVSGPEILAHERLAGAKAHFQDYLAGQRHELGTGYEDWLLALFRKVTQQLVVMVYTVDSMADVGVIFETMNNRGKPISELEKVKNYLLYAASRLELAGPNPLAEQVNRAWTHVFEHLAAARLVQADDEDRLLRAHWLMAYDPDARNWQGSRSIKERFSLRRFQGQHQALLAELKTYVDSLQNACTAFCDAYRPTHSDAFGSFRDQGDAHRQVVLASEKLSRLRVVASFLPLLMATRIRRPADAAGYLEMVRLCEQYAFRVYRWLGLRSNAGLGALYRLGHSLFVGDALNDAMDGLRALLLRYCSEEQFRERFRRETENWFEWSGIKYMLYEYEEHLAAREGLGLRMMWDDLERRNKEDTVEHILPRNPAGDGYWTSRFSPEARQRYTNDIGNLCLTFYNSELSNKPFPDKRGQAGSGHGYANSVIVMEQRLARYDDWTPETIEERRREIEAWALERWHVEAPAAPSEGNGAAGAGETSPDGGWKQRTREERLALLRALAEEGGLAAPYDALTEVATRHGLYLRPYPQALMIAPPSKRTVALFSIWPQQAKIFLGFWSQAWPTFFPVSAAQVEETLGVQRSNHMTGADVKAFVERLDRLLSEIGVRTAS